jgi:hypothetical protein
MVTIYIVKSEKCQHNTKVIAEIKQNDIVAINIRSTCSRVRKYGEELKEVHAKDLVKPILTNPVYIIASNVVCPGCAVLSGVIYASWAEIGLISKNLLKEYPLVVIKYEEP